MAIDVQPEMLKVLEKRMEREEVSTIRPILGDVVQGDIEQDAYDRAIPVTVPGEIPDREEALRAVFWALKPGGIPSITEIFPDPHYQTRATVKRLAEGAGFRPDKQTGNWFAFTKNFAKPLP